jgi:hypothetical protein
VVTPSRCGMRSTIPPHAPEAHELSLDNKDMEVQPVIVAGVPLLGVALGMFGNWVIQRSIERSKQREARNTRLRELYSKWSGECYRYIKVLRQDELDTTRDEAFGGQPSSLDEWTNSVQVNNETAGVKTLLASIRLEENVDYRFLIVEDTTRTILEESTLLNEKEAAVLVAIHRVGQLF